MRHREDDIGMILWSAPTRPPAATAYPLAAAGSGVALEDRRLGQANSPSCPDADNRKITA
jgi:hypothetical protein